MQAKIQLLNHQRKKRNEENANRKQERMKEKVTKTNCVCYVKKMKHVSEK